MKAAIQIVSTCAKVYDEELAGKNILFVYSPNEYVECFFPKSSFLHLTGLVYDGSAADFYRQSLSGHLSPAKLAFKPDGTTDMKLQILPQLVQIHYKAKMIGSYNGTKPLLYTDQLVGNPIGCLGFIRVNGILQPNTALKDDIRDLTTDTKRVLAVFRKERDAEKYDELCRLAKGISLEMPVKCTPCQVQNLLSGSSSATSCDIMPSLCR